MLKTTLSKDGRLVYSAEDAAHDAMRAHELLARLNQLTADSCETDTAIRESCRKVLGNEVDGDSYCVPPVEELVEKVVGKVKELEAELNLLKTLIASQDDIDNFKVTPEMYRGFLRKFIDNPERAAEILGVSVEEIRSEQSELEAELAKERSDG